MMGGAREMRHESYRGQKNAKGNCESIKEFGIKHRTARPPSIPHPNTSCHSFAFTIRFHTPMSKTA
jgi:hypothetical protein